MDRFEEAMSIIEDRLKPEFKRFLDRVISVYEDVNYLDWNDWDEYSNDESEDGLEAFMEDVFAKYMK